MAKGIPINGVNKGWFKKGSTHTVSIETRNKISSAKKGRYFNLPITEETRKKLSLAHRGSKHHMYGKHLSEKHIQILINSRKGKVPWNKGKGKNSENRLERIKFHDTMQRKILERDNYTCQMCGTRGKTMQVDHIQSWAEYVSLRFSMDNCRTLCIECHYRITFGKPKPEKVKTWGMNIKNVRNY